MNLNRMLFGMIGILMLTIVGIGTGAVKTELQSNTATKVASADTGTPTIFKIFSGETTSETKAESTIATGEVKTIQKDLDDDADRESDDDSDDDDVRTSASVRTQTSNTQTSGQTSATSKTATQTAGTYTLADIAKHNSPSSCYTAVSGGVYDLTPFINQHRGGSQAILSLCGIDGTAKFMAQHGGQGRPEQELASLKIGTLAK